MMRWLPIPGRDDLELSERATVRRIPKVRGRDFQLRPHPSKRICLSEEEVAALGLDIPVLRAELFPPAPEPSKKGRR